MELQWTESGHRPEMGDHLCIPVIGVGTFLLDNEGDIELMTAKQKVIFENFFCRCWMRLAGSW